LILTALQLIVRKIRAKENNSAAFASQADYRAAKIVGPTRATPFAQCSGTAGKHAKRPSDNVASFRIEAERIQADLVGCVASIVDALACLTFLFLPATPATVARLCIMLLVDPVTSIIGYWLMYRRLHDIRPKLAELGFYLLVSGTLFVVGQNVVEESASLNRVTLDYSTANGFSIPLELLVTFTLPFGLAIYAWLIATSPALHRWLGFMMGAQVVLLFIALGSFAFPRLSDFVNSQLLAVYAIILSCAKAVWFLLPRARAAKPQSILE
jgi:hypothetical protein